MLACGEPLEAHHKCAISVAGSCKSTEYRFAKHKSQRSIRSLQCEQWDRRLRDVQRISDLDKEQQAVPTVTHSLPFFVSSISGSTADLPARSYFALRLVRSGMEVVADAAIAFPYLLKVNEALLGTSEYERDINYSRVSRVVRDDKLEQLPTVSPEVVAA